MTRRAFRAALPAVALQLAVFLLAAIAHGQVVKESDGIHWWPGRTRVGPEKCATRDTRQGGHGDGTCAYFSDAVPNSAPMTCGGAGAYCCHQHGEWDCLNAASCAAVGQPCSVNGDCCTDLCSAGTCANPSGGGICTPDAAVPVAQRALRTVATSGTCEDNWIPFCDVRNYGAKGDDTTDDSAAFAAAITACCAGGTVYVPRSTAPYKVTQGFNNDETCVFNLLGDGAIPFAEASTVHLATAINTNCVTGPPRTCDALFDLAGGWAQDIALKGPNAFAITPGTDNENSDGLHFPGDVTRVEITRFTTALEFPNIVRDSTISNDYIGAISPREIWRSEFNSHNYASVYFDGSATVASHYSGYGAAPYLWISTNGAANVTSDDDAFGGYGNAGIAFAGAHVVNNLRLAPAGSLTTGQNNLYKLGAVAVDNALHLGIVQGRNTIVAADDLINQAGHCHIDTLDTGGTVRFIVNNAPAVEISGTCQIDSGSSAAFTVCNESETQCMPQAITTLGTGANLSPAEGASVYFVPTSATDVQAITPTAGACTHFSGQRITLVFTGSRKMKHEAVGTGCELALQGGADFNAATGNTLTVLHDGTRWREIARSTPPS